MQDNWERILAKYGGGLLLTDFIRLIVPLVRKCTEKAVSGSITVFPIFHLPAIQPQQNVSNVGSNELVNIATTIELFIYN